MRGSTNEDRPLNELRLDPADETAPGVVEFERSPHPRAPGTGAAGSFLVGTWLSLVEHSLGVRGVGSSNLPVPTILHF